MPEPVSCTEPTADDHATNKGKACVTFRLQLVVVNASGHEHVQEVARIERDEVAMETLGFTLAEGKLILKALVQIRGGPYSGRFARFDWDGSDYAVRAACQISGILAVRPASLPILN